MSAKRRCGTCEFWEGQARGRSVGRCTKTVDLPAMPDAMTRCYGFSWPPSKRFVERSDGETCPTWLARTAITQATQDQGGGSR